MQHWAYQPLLPAGSKYLQQKWDKASYDMHRRKVKSAMATINTSPPRTYDHLALKTKKQKLEEEQAMKTHRENLMLLGKISHIMRTTGQIDNRNHYERKSLGRERRQQEQFRITEQNQVIQFRLNQCKPFYSVMAWHEDWLKTLKLMDNIALYPRGRASDPKNSPKCQQSQRHSQSSGDSGTREKTNETAPQTSDGKMTNGTGTCEQREQGKKTNNKQPEAGTHLAPKAILDKSISSEECSSASETATITPDNLKSSSLSHRSERSSSPHTPHTSRPNTPETHTLKDGTTEDKDTSDED